MASAFTSPLMMKRVSSMKALKMAVDQPGPSYWDGDAPPSSVLGVGAKVPSAIFGVGSLLALGVGLYCVGESNVFHQLKESTVYPGYIAGAQLVPISWGMHVAAWIQKKNKK
eukprot:CAMPEP_0119039120 /NCGR_PEP_ID=MMETSP1177-20130426/8454_1 /TAXON_ID=2985 /ORGANISM="Ochromonas sp, Strain CCMP1899" /LENGTH=111 /DNA_ID=CAMNT_0007002601 /DNA_START=83 /DNA_END=418 /DNA_ORIENTATION=-